MWRQKPSDKDNPLRYYPIGVDAGVSLGSFTNYSHRPGPTVLGTKHESGGSA